MSGEYEEQVKGEKMEDMEEKEEKLTLEKFEEATEAVSKVISETKLVYSEHFSNMTGNKVYFKPENMQYTGAYKVRGAYYKISTLSEEEKSRGLITASAGNHAQGVAYAAKLAGAGAVIVMPTTTPLMKVNRTRSYGAEVVLHGDVFDEALAHAKALGIATAEADGSFRPNDPVTRQDAMVFLLRAMQAVNRSVPNAYDSYLSRFPDGASVADYARTAMAAMAQAGVIQGNEQGKLNPTGTLNRAEMAVILHRALTL